MTASLDAIIQRWQASIPDKLERLDIPGLAIGVCDRGGVVWTAGFGSTARAGGSSITPRTRFSVQSTSKLVTAGVVLTAVQRGLVDLDQPITKYLPDFRVNSSFDDDPGRLITLRHMLSHTAGFTHEAPVGSNYDLGTGRFEDHCRSIHDTWLRFPVGHHYEYSNLGIDLAGLAVQRACGEPFARIADELLLAPVGAARATFDTAVIVDDPERAIGHWGGEFTPIVQPPPVVVPMQPSGGLYASVEDILRVVAVHLRGGTPVLEPTAFAEHYRIPFAPAEQSLGYALGVSVDEWDGIPVRHHGGSGFGFQCQVCWLPSIGLGVAVLTNSFHHGLDDQLARGFVRDVASDLVEPGRTDEPMTPSVAPDDLLGEYVGRLDAIRVATQDGRLLVTTGDTAYPARLLADRVVEVDSPVRERWIFLSRADGVLGYLRSARSGTTYYRNEPDSVAPGRLPDRAAGHYASSVFGVPFGHYLLEQDDATPVLRENIGSDRARTIRLGLLTEDRFISTTGEILDLTGEHPRYANIPFVPMESARAEPGPVT